MRPEKKEKYHNRSKLLLHTCCACCATEAINRLKNDYGVTLFWYNPNIYPYSEYKKRLGSFKKLAIDLGNKSIICHSEWSEESQSRSFSRTDRLQDDKQYKIENTKWQKYIAGLENEPEGGKRCEQCYQFRLEQTTQAAKDNDFDIFATTLTISPHKNAALINRIGQDITKRTGINFIEADFKKQNGFKKSIELSRKHNLYRQHYCGCKYSMHE